jgi:hypothetical protein
MVAKSLSDAAARKYRKKRAEKREVAALKESGG